MLTGGAGLLPTVGTQLYLVEGTYLTWIFRSLADTIYIALCMHVW